MSFKWYSFNIIGLLTAFIFTIFTFISVALYPTPYNPLYDWVSNLGNINLNPFGSLFFNLGCIITGLILIPFIISLYQWNPSKIWSKIFLMIGIILHLLEDSLSISGIPWKRTTGEPHAQIFLVSSTARLPVSMDTHILLTRSRLSAILCIMSSTR